jgi:hypothetical protein
MGTMVSRLLAGAALMAALGVGGCALPPEDAVARQARSQLPTDWTLVSSGDWRYRKLPVDTRVAIEDVKLQMAQERDTSAFSFYGRYSDSMYARIAQLNSSANQQFVQVAIDELRDAELAERDRQVSALAINRNLTPELMGIAERPSDIDRNMAVVGNQNLRMF